jgi:hypothetical protein
VPAAAEATDQEKAASAAHTRDFVRAPDTENASGFADAPDAERAEGMAVETSMAASLAKMPTVWLQDMHQATLEGDWDWMMALIAQVREQGAALAADVLAELAYNFEHQTILELVQQAAG